KHAVSHFERREHAVIKLAHDKNIRRFTSWITARVNPDVPTVFEPAFLQPDNQAVSFWGLYVGKVEDGSAQKCALAHRDGFGRQFALPNYVTFFIHEEALRYGVGERPWSKVRDLNFGGENLVRFPGPLEQSGHGHDWSAEAAKRFGGRITLG